MNDDALTKLRELVPVRDLPLAERDHLGVAREGRSRPRVIARQPKADTYLAELAEARAEAAAAAPLVSANKDPDQDVDILDVALRELARECGAIAFERTQAELRGVDVGPLCSRRISGLVQIAALVVEKDRRHPPDLDVRGAPMQKIVANFMALLREAAEETLGPDAEKFLSAYTVKVSGWEDWVDPRPTARQTGVK